MRFIDPSVVPADSAMFYRQILRDLRPGITEIIVHLGENTEEEHTHSLASGVQIGSHLLCRSIGMYLVAVDVRRAGYRDAALAGRVGARPMRQVMRANTRRTPT